MASKHSKTRLRCNIAIFSRPHALSLAHVMLRRHLQLFVNLMLSCITDCTDRVKYNPENESSRREHLNVYLNAHPNNVTKVEIAPDASLYH